MNTISRRQLLQTLIAGSVLSASPKLFAQTLSQSDSSIHTSLQGWFSPQGADSEHFGFGAALNAADGPTLQTGLSGFRGHGGAQHPTKPDTVLMFARRPGRESIEVNLRSGEVTARFETPKNRHFFGHGAFSMDGQILFTTEADLERNVGVIGIRNAQTYQWLGEMDSGGVGPHELKRVDDQHLVIANGGILTRPEQGRKKLNLATMVPNLTYLNYHTGDIVEQVQPPDSKASIRHLDVAADGTVAFGMQLQRQACDHERLVPLAGFHKLGQAPRFLAEPDFVVRQLQDYVGSVTLSDQSRLAGFTSPKGDLAAFWHLDSGEFAGHHAMQDVCGLALNGPKDGFVLTNSFGTVHEVDAHSLKERVNRRQHFPKLAWDNHMLTLG
jgi:hypothetical protein